MKSKILNYWIFIIAVLLSFPIVACRESSNTQVPAKKTDAATALANPAAVKCINDGFVLEPALRDGVAIYYICKNLKNGKKCEAWKYFQEECSLK